jgi:hypothetical protein
VPCTFLEHSFQDDLNVGLLQSASLSELIRISGDWQKDTSIRRPSAHKITHNARDLDRIRLPSFQFQRFCRSWAETQRDLIRFVPVTIYPVSKMVTALIPPRYRAIAFLVTLLGLIGLLTHIHHTHEPFRRHVDSIFTQRIRKGESRQTWWQAWGWKSAVSVSLGEGIEELAGRAGTTRDVVEATRERILGLQSQCKRDDGRWEHEYGYASLILVSGIDFVS